MAGHRFQGPWDNANRTYPTLFEKDGWRSASNMDAHMWLNVGRIPELPIPSLENVVFDEEFFYFVGRFLGDGWVWESRDGSTNQQVGVCCGFRDVESLMPHMKALGWKFSEQDQRTGHYWRCYDKTKFHWFEDNFGRGAINKHLPGWTFGMKKEMAAGLVTGVLGVGRQPDPERHARDLDQPKTHTRNQDPGGWTRARIQYFQP